MEKLAQLTHARRVDLRFVKLCCNDCGKKYGKPLEWPLAYRKGTCEICEGDSGGVNFAEMFDIPPAHWPSNVPLIVKVQKNVII